MRLEVLGLNVVQDMAETAVERLGGWGDAVDNVCKVFFQKIAEIEGIFLWRKVEIGGPNAPEEIAEWVKTKLRVRKPVAVAAHGAVFEDVSIVAMVPETVDEVIGVLVVILDGVFLVAAKRHELKQADFGGVHQRKFFS